MKTINTIGVKLMSLYRVMFYNGGTPSNTAHIR